MVSGNLSPVAFKATELQSHRVSSVCVLPSRPHSGMREEGEEWERKGKGPEQRKRAPGRRPMFAANKPLKCQEVHLSVCLAIKNSSKIGQMNKSDTWHL